MAALDSSFDLNYSDSDESAASDISVGEFTDEFARHFFDLFGENSDKEEEEFTGFRFEMPDEMEWVVLGQPKRSADLNRNPATRPGPQVDLQAGLKALDFFQLYFTEELLEKITEWTMKYANQKLDTARRDDAEEGPHWTMTVEELKAYLGMIIITNNLMIVPRTERYFIVEDGKWLFHTNLSKIFTRKRFREIQRYIHFVDPSHRRPEIGEPGYDRLFMVRPVLDHLQTKFKQLYVMERDISIDESMIPFKGHLSWIQRMPQKPVKVGIKVFVVAEASTGYCWNFQIYIGKHEGQEDDVGDLGKTDRVVINLLADLTYQGYHLYLDNFYTSVPLTLFLS